MPNITIPENTRFEEKGSDLLKKSDPFSFFTFNKAELQKMIDEKKSVKEIAEHFKAPEASIRTKLSRMGIKLRDVK